MRKDATRVEIPALMQCMIDLKPTRKECEVKTTFGMIESAYMCCPNCECVPYGVYSFCPHCGQALDWSSL